MALWGQTRPSERVMPWFGKSEEQGDEDMLKLAAVLMMMTAPANVPAPPVNFNPDAAPANQPYVAQPGPPADATIQHGVFDPRGTPGLPISVRIVNPPAPPPPP